MRGLDGLLSAGASRGVWSCSCCWMQLGGSGLAKSVPSRWKQRRESANRLYSVVQEPYQL